MAKTFEAEVRALGVILDALEPLNNDQRAFVLKTAAERVKIQPAQTQTTPIAGEHGHSTSGEPLGDGASLTPKRFLALKKPANDVQRVACLAYYLAHERKQDHFKTKDITALNTEAAGIPIGNPAQAVANATQVSHYLAAAGGGSKQITTHGEDVVKALPDQTAVGAVRKDTPRTRRRRTKKHARA